jgi:hypothetical protein
MANKPMTLIITAASDNIAVQAADTRITWTNRKSSNDLAIKTVIVHCHDAKIAISFTGIAVIDTKRTDEWLAYRLYRAAQKVMTFQEVVQFCARELTAATTRNRPLATIGLTLVFVGLGIPADGRRSSAIAMVSNSQEIDNRPRRTRDVNPVGRAFACSFMSPHVRWYIGMTGAVDGGMSLNAYRKQIERRLTAAKTEDEAKRLLDFLVEVIRKIRRGRFQSVISDQCVGVCITSDYWSHTFFYGKIGTLKRPPYIVKKTNEA